MRVKSLYKVTLNLILFWMSTGIFFSLIGLSAPHIGINQYAFIKGTTYINYVIFFFALICGLFSLNQKTNTEKNRIFIFFLLLFAAYGAFVGVINEHFGIELLKHFLMLLFFSVLFFFGYNIFTYITIINFKRFINLAFVLNFFATIFFFYLSVFFSIYPGFGSQAMGYVIIYNLVLKRKVFFFSALLLLVLQGKRSILISTLSCIIIFHALKSPKLKNVLLKVTIFLPIICIISLYFIETMNLYEIPGLKRLNLINPFSPKFDLLLGSSGRLDEIICAFTQFSENPLNFILGAGFGFTYDWQISFDESFLENKSYVHMTPVMLLLIFGPIFMIMCYRFLFNMTLKTIKLSRIQKNHNEELLYAFVALASIYFIISGIFSLNIVADPFGLMCLGLCYGAINYNKRNVCYKIKNQTVNA